MCAHSSLDQQRLTGSGPPSLPVPPRVIRARLRPPKRSGQAKESRRVGRRLCRARAHMDGAADSEGSPRLVLEVKSFRAELRAHLRGLLQRRLGTSQCVHALTYACSAEDTALHCSHEFAAGGGQAWGAWR